MLITVFGVDSMCSIRSALRTSGAWLIRVRWIMGSTRSEQSSGVLIGSRLSNVSRKLLQNFSKRAQFLANRVDERGRGVREQVALRHGGLGRLLRSRHFRLAARVQVFPRAFDGEPLLVEQSLDFEHQFDVFAPVQAMSGSRFPRTQCRKLRFPES